MSKKGGWREIDASSRASLTRFFSRTHGFEPTSADMPFDRMLDVELTDGNLAALKALPDEESFFSLVAKAREEDEELEVGADEIRQRMIGVRALIEFLGLRAVTPMDYFRQLCAVMRALHVAPFHQMTTREVGMMEGQSHAAHAWRCKVMSGEIELAGMRGSKLPGQKSKAASESYKKARKGNNNRKGGAKATARQKRQSKILQKLREQKTAGEPEV